MPFAVPAVIARLVYLVCEDSFRIVPGALPEALHSLLQGSPLVIGVKGYPLNSPIALRIQAQIEFGTELHRGRGLAPDYGAQPWLADAHDAARDVMHLIVVASAVRTASGWSGTSGCPSCPGQGPPT